MGFMLIDHNAYNSALNKLNSVYKTLFFAAVLIYGIAIDNIRVSLFIIASMAFITVCLGRIKPDYYLRIMKIPALFIVLSITAIAVIFSRAETGLFTLSVGGINIFVTQNGISESIHIIIRAFGALSCMYGLALSTPMADIIDVLRKFKLPEIIIELMFLIYRFIFVLLDTVRNMTKAAISRNGYCGVRASFYSFGNIGKNLLLYSLKKANSAYDAMESRGYEGSIAFYSEDSKVKIGEIVFFVLYFVVMICLS